MHFAPVCCLLFEGYLAAKSEVGEVGRSMLTHLSRAAGLSVGEPALSLSVQVASGGDTPVVTKRLVTGVLFILFFRSTFSFFYHCVA